MSDPKKRRPFVAALFNAAIPGLGFLYLGNVRLAAAMLLVWPALLAFGAWTRLVFVPLGFYLVVVLAVATWLASVIIAWRIARHKTPAPLTKLQRWYVYLGFVVFASVTLNVLLDNRGALLGYETFKIPSSSMRETLLPGDYFISDSWKYRSEDPERGALVVFLFPRNPSVKYVERVIGMPGDMISVSPGEVRVNGAVLNEPYVAPANNRGLPIGNGEFSVPSNSYFVLGDNRDNSNDSRFWGMVPRGNLYGSVEFIWFSHDANNGVRVKRFGQRVK